MKYKRKLLLILLLGLICYLNSLRGEFIWDDYYLIVSNPAIKSFNNIAKIFSSDLFSSTNYYRPLQSLTYLFEYHIYKLNPFGYHLHNLILHILNAMLVFFIFKFLAKNLFISLAGALLFVCAPFHTEAVAYISARADLLSGLFILSSFLFYIKNRRIISFSFFLLALFAKEYAIILPLLLVVYDLFFTNSIRENRKYYLLFFVYDLLYMVLRVNVLNFSGLPLWQGKTYFANNIGILPRVFTFFKSILLYFNIIIFPNNLHMQRANAVVYSLFNPYFLFSLAVFIFCIYFSLKSKHKLLLFGYFWFIILLLPQSSLIFSRILAEHFIYLPSIGIFLILSLLLESIFKKRKDFAVLILCIFLAFYTTLTVTFSLNWLNPVRFHKWTLRFSPYDHKMHYLLGIYYEENGLLDLAAEEFAKAIEYEKKKRLGKTNLDGLESAQKNNLFYLSLLHQNMGAILSKKGMLDEAGAEFKIAIDYNPKFIQPYNDLGCVYIKQNELDKAEEILNKALAINPDFEKAWYNLSSVYLGKQDLEKAVNFLKRALKINPDYKLASERLKEIRDGSKIKP